MVWRKKTEIFLRFLCSHAYLKCIVWSHTDSSSSSILQLHFWVQLFFIFLHNIRQVRTSAALRMVLFTMAIVRLISRVREKNLYRVTLKIFVYHQEGLKAFPRFEFQANTTYKLHNAACSSVLADRSYIKLFAYLCSQFKKSNLNLTGDPKKNVCIQSTKSSFSLDQIRII